MITSPFTSEELTLANHVPRAQEPQRLLVELPQVHVDCNEELESIRNKLMAVNFNHLVLHVQSRYYIHSHGTMVLDENNKYFKAMDERVSWEPYIILTRV